MKFEKFFSGNELKQANNIIQKFHGRLLLDPKIGNPLAVALGIYMASNESKKSFVEKSIAKEIFKSFGRDSTDFDKTLYEISGKRKGKTKLIDTNEKGIGLNFNGLEKVRGLFGRVNSQS